jgi:hypothetical protein
VQKITLLAGPALALLGATACGPHAVIPATPPAPAPATTPTLLEASIARSSAPTLYLQPDETFRLARVVAVVHPNGRMIGYHLLWSDDVQGAWLPFTDPTDHEVVWVGVDGAGATTDLWTYWHGVILHAPWHDRGRPEVDVQWGKHGSMPRRTVAADLPFPRKQPAFYALAWMLPDLWLGAFEREGPLCFCRGYRRYATFSEPYPLADRLDVIVRTDEPAATLRATFGAKYAKKPEWP